MKPSSIRSWLDKSLTSPRDDTFVVAEDTKFFCRGRSRYCSSASALDVAGAPFPSVFWSCRLNSRCSLTRRSRMAVT
eukprot:1822825-Amphidinium_carterae.1